MTEYLDEPIVVVGGGLAGIAASLSLVDQGRKVVLLESRRQLGGRVGSFYDREMEQWVDYCQHVGMNCCTNLRWLIERLGQTESWEVQKSLHFFTAKGFHINASGWYLPAPFHLAGLLLNWPELGFIERMRIALGMWRLRGLSMLRYEQWRNESIVNWLSNNFQSEGTQSKFWGTILTSALGEKLDRITLGAAHKVLIDGFMANRTAYHLIVPRLPLSQLVGRDGLAVLEQTGIDVRLESPVSCLVWKGDQVVGLQVRDKVISCSQLIIAVPWHSIDKLFANAPSVQGLLPTALSQKSLLESAPITGVHTWWDREWLKAPHAILIDRLSHWVFPGPLSERNRERPKSEERPMVDSFYYQVVISGSRDLPQGDPSKTIDEVVRDLREVFPECRTSQLLRARVVTDPNAVFSVASNHHQGRLPSDAIKNDQIWLAGDWIDTGWPSTMESAILSGRNAAMQLVKSSES